MPLQQTSGNDTQDAYGGGKAVVPVYVENVFSTYLYTGTDAAQSITNNIALSTSGGLVWIKDRTNAYNNNLFDTTQGATKLLHSNTTDATTTDTNSLTSFNTTGFTLGSGNTSGNQVNTSSDNFVSWTFRKQPKFFDIVTYTGNGTSQNIAHNLGSTPGCIIVKRTDAGASWIVYHVGTNGGSSPQNYALVLNATNAQSSGAGFWNGTAPTSTQFSVGNSASTNNSGATYIAYIFGAGGTGGFGLTGTQDIISCGYFTGAGSGVPVNVNLGFEAQWILTKRVNSTSPWSIQDIMRGSSITDTLILFPNTTSSDVDNANYGAYPTATGFADANWSSGDTIIYIAIRRGPMATPTTGTSVFAPVAQNVTNPSTITTGFPVDLVIEKQNAANVTGQNIDFDRLRGSSQTSSVYLRTNQTAAEVTYGYGIGFDNNSSIVDNFMYQQGVTSTTSYWNFRRAPSFFDEVCYTGTGTAITFNHNLGVAPELIIVKKRSGTSTTGWLVGATTIGYANKLYLNLTNASAADSTAWNSTAPTSTVFSVGTNTDSNASAATFVAYLFATCPGVSKVGSYTGTGATQSIACGFGAGGARFILAKRTDSTGDWYVWDSANGLTSGSSPYLQWDTINAQTTGNNGTYASSGGFTLTSASPVNTSGGSFIFLAIA